MIEGNPVREDAKRLADRAAQTWNISTLTARDIYPLGTESDDDEELFSPVIGTAYSHFSPLSFDTRSFSELYEYPGEGIESLLEAYLRYDPFSGLIEAQPAENSPKQFARYLQSFENDNIVETQVVRVLHQNPQLLPFFESVMRTHPVIGTATVLLYKKYQDTSSSMKNGLEKFVLPKVEERFSQKYVEAIDSAAKTKESIDVFFAKLKSFAANEYERTEVTEFLTAFQDDVLLNHIETVGTMTAISLHLETGNCGVFMSSLPVRVGQSSFERKRREVLGLWDIKGSNSDRSPLYNRWNQGIKSYNETATSENGVLSVPLFASSIDFWEYMRTYQAYWSQIEVGLGSKKGLRREKREVSNSEMRFYFGNAVSILIRPEEGENNNGKNVEARIGIEGHGSYYGMNLRVDDERGRDTLALDVGKVEYEQLFSYAKELAEHDAEGEGFFSHYDGIIKEDTASNLIRIGNSNHLFSSANHAAIIHALSMQANNEMRTRKGDYFSYHGRENVNQKHFHDNFPKIARSLQSMFLRQLNS